MRTLDATPNFKRDLEDIPASIRTEANEVVFKLRSNPLDHTLHLRKLSGFSVPVWRVKIGVYRIIYTFTETAIILYRFRHRKDVYRNLRF